MKRNVVLVMLLCAALSLSGCVVRTYKATRDRIDQDLVSGNRGYLMGNAPAAPERKSTRSTQVVEIELRSPLQFEKKNSVESGASGSALSDAGGAGMGSESSISEANMNLEKYTVQKGDTLQKISQKFYGTTKRWKKIYDINQGVLKGPDKIRPGQVLSIPASSQEKLKEPSENLK